MGGLQYISDVEGELGSELIKLIHDIKKMMMILMVVIMRV